MIPVVPVLHLLMTFPDVVYTMRAIRSKAGQLLDRYRGAGPVGDHAKHTALVQASCFSFLIPV